MDFSQVMVWPSFAECLGVAAFIIIVLTYQSNKRRHMLYIQAIGLVLLTTHLALIGALTGAVMMGALLVRNILFSFKDRWKWARHPVLFHATIIVLLVLATLSWEGYISLFALFGALIGTYAFWFDNPRYIRRVMLFSAFLWLPYAFVSGSYPMMFVQLFLLASILLAMWRFDRSGSKRPIPVTSFGGVVEKGDGYGKTLGFPTANIDRKDYNAQPDQLGHGVYAGSVTVVSKNSIYPAGIVIGPTDNSGDPKLEAHLIDFDGDLYGEEVVFTIEMYMRPLITYQSEMALRSAIQEDINHIRDRIIGM